MDPWISHTRSGAKPAFWNWPSTFEAEARDPPEQQAEAGVRDRVAVELQAVAVEAPAERRIVAEVGRVGGVLEAQAQVLVHRVRAPEPRGAAEVGQPGVDPHAGAGGHQQGPRPLQRRGGLLRGDGVVHALPPAARARRYGAAQIGRLAMDRKFNRTHASVVRLEDAVKRPSSTFLVQIRSLSMRWH
jgi:hypothetical protein